MLTSTVVDEQMESDSNWTGDKCESRAMSDQQ
jgi:hypothetical protein